jgi:hypothetical protein
MRKFFVAEVDTMSNTQKAQEKRQNNELWFKVYFIINGVLTEYAKELKETKRRMKERIVSTPEKVSHANAVE